MTTQIHPIDVILRKRDGHALTDPEIESFVTAVVTARATDAQIASFLMAVFQRGLNPAELAALTRAMRFSGETFHRPDPADQGGVERPARPDEASLHQERPERLARWEGGPSFRIDKHSTGGVGDKTSLLIAPICAAAGLSVPMISGRSLGHTGGTLDKLETIPGFNTQFSVADFSRILAECNFAMAGHRVGKGEPFLNLDQLRAGDAVIVETRTAWYVYRVKGQQAGLTAKDADGIPGREIVSPTDGDVLLPVPDHPGQNATEALLTMTTCHPKFTAQKRMIVYAALDNAATVKVTAKSGDSVLTMPASVQALYNQVSS